MSSSETDTKLRYFFSRAVNRRVAFVFCGVFFVLTVALFAYKQYLYGWASLPVMLSNIWFATSFGDVTVIADRTRSVLQVQKRAPFRNSLEEYDFDEIKKVVHDYIRYTRHSTRPSRYFLGVILKDGRQKILYGSPENQHKVAEHLNDFIRG